MSMELGRSRAYAHLLHHIVDGSYERSFAPFAPSSAADGGSAGFQSLPVNVWETEDTYVAALLAPGLDEQTLNVTVHENTLAIEGALRVQAPEGARAVWHEFDQGPTRFRRALQLGTSVDASKVEALFSNGLLMVTMAKAERAKPRQIQVQGLATLAALEE